MDGQGGWGIGPQGNGRLVCVGGGGGQGVWEVPPLPPPRRAQGLCHKAGPRDRAAQCLWGRGCQRAPGGRQRRRAQGRLQNSAPVPRLGGRGGGGRRSTCRGPMDDGPWRRPPGGPAQTSQGSPPSYLRKSKTDLGGAMHCPSQSTGTLWIGIGRGGGHKAAVSDCLPLVTGGGGGWHCPPTHTCAHTNCQLRSNRQLQLSNQSSLETSVLDRQEWD